MVDVREAHAYAVEVFEQHGLRHYGWTIAWNRMAGTAGVANYRTRTVTFSARAVEAWDWPLVEQLVLHELAHVLVGPGQAHGKTWARAVKDLGGTPAEFCPRFSSPAARFLGKFGEGGNLVFLGLTLVAAWVAAPGVAAVLTLAGGIGALVAASRSARPVLSFKERMMIEKAVLEP